MEFLSKSEQSEQNPRSNSEWLNSLSEPRFIRGSIAPVGVSYSKNSAERSDLQITDRLAENGPNELPQLAILLGSAAGAGSELLRTRIDHTLLRTPPELRTGWTKWWESQSPLLQTQLSAMERLSAAEQYYAANLGAQDLWSGLHKIPEHLKHLVHPNALISLEIEQQGFKAGVKEAESLLTYASGKLSNVMTASPDYKSAASRGLIKGLVCSAVSLAAGATTDSFVASASRTEMKHSNLRFLIDGVVTPAVVLSPIPPQYKVAGALMSFCSGRAASYYGW